MPEQCEICKGAGVLVREVPVGHPDFGRTWPCPDQCHTEERLARLARVSGLDESELGLRLSDFKAMSPEDRKMFAQINGFLEAPTAMLYLWGGSGSGKTLILKALVNEFNERGRLGVYTKFTKLLWWMRQVFGDNGERESFLDRYARIKGVPVLAIDEFDKARLTEFALEFQFDFLDDRYEAGLRDEGCTIFASNSSPDDLPSYLKSRIEDGRCLVIQNTADDLRPHMRKKT